MFGLRKYVAVYVVIIALIVCTTIVDAKSYYEPEVTLTFAFATTNDIVKWEQ